MTNYNKKFEKLIEEDEEREKQEKEEERMRLRLKHETEQQKKQKAWDAKLVEQGKDPVKERQKYGGCAFSHMNHMLHNPEAHSQDDHSHGNGHSCSHDHGHQHGSSNSSKSSCGYMPVDQINQLSAQKKNEPSVEEKNIKKIAAVYATKEDGNRLFKEKNYELAYKVYERGTLIINGMYDLSEKDETDMENIECLLDLNMALVSLKREQWSQAIDCCKMAIQIDDKNAKAYYRWSEALIAMSEYDEARKQSFKAKELEPNNVAVDRQLEKIDKLQTEQLEKARKEEQKMAQRIRERLQK
eukprot:CAMPEP_0202712592 /NCGR_PEP_ID=MMETSP1385-20130828/43528_1 /ASSEMBLY_ACC=CAM_ASM_000861 /TAXON_ID=933848 /ORGANISM="Elphidium margaritaceum" /LENGTH=298 /DNA_ID=CAMNT_0049372679 /DNA_START=22 /DNA_END=918 /DNA_ORIENTATION=-